MNAETIASRPGLPRAAATIVAGFALVMALVGAAPDAGDRAHQPSTERIELDSSRVVPYEEHPASSIIDKDTRKLMATRHIPGFGGAYVDAETGTLHVWLTQPTKRLGLDARAVLARYTRSPSLASSRVVVQPASYTFAQLASWKERARDLFAFPEVVFLGISERDNRLWLGLHGATRLSSAIVERLEGLGVPPAAVVVKSVQRPPKPLLRDDHRPLTGGTQIQFQSGFGGFGTGTCTLGFPALRDGADGFVTNAHCSRTQGEIDDGRYWQATRPAFDTNQVGTEVYDPPFFVGGPCPADKVCSFTDANYVMAHGGVGVDRGVLAAVPCCDSLDWDGTSSWRVTDNFFTFLGNTVRKVGRTTGTTFGTVVAECMDTDVADSNIHLLCQDVIEMPSDFGDSGSPVFEITHSPAINDVRAVGILWGLAEVDDVNFTFITPTPFVRDVITGPGLCAPGFGC